MNRLVKMSVIVLKKKFYNLGKRKMRVRSKVKQNRGLKMGFIIITKELLEESYWM